MDATEQEEKSTMQKCLEGLKMGFYVLVMIAGVVFALGTLSYQHEKKCQNTYQVWCKQTGNPKQLTYTEWRTLYPPLLPLESNRTPRYLRDVHR